MSTNRGFFEVARMRHANGTEGVLGYEMVGAWTPDIDAPYQLTIDGWSVTSMGGYGSTVEIEYLHHLLMHHRGDEKCSDLRFEASGKFGVYSLDIAPVGLDEVMVAEFGEAHWSIIPVDSDGEGEPFEDYQETFATCDHYRHGSDLTEVYAHAKRAGWEPVQPLTK